MEKLVKLLNEYEEDKIKGTQWLSVMFIWKYEWVLYYYDNYKDENVFDNIRLLIISKEYEFIEWLVREEKIDTYKLEKIWYEKTVFRYDWQYIEIVEYSDYESLLMLLSIQENPISFLLSILN